MAGWAPPTQLSPPPFIPPSHFPPAHFFFGTGWAIQKINFMFVQSRGLEGEESGGLCRLLRKQCLKKDPGTVIQTQAHVLPLL